MAISHFYNQTVADGTATSVVRPSDWNSAHNMVLNIASNTAGTSQISGSDIIWAGGNNITLSASSNGVTIVGPSTAAQTVQTQASGNIVGVGFTSTTIAGAVVAATHNSAGLLMAVPSYLTTAAQSNHSHNFATTTTGGSNIVVGTANSAGATVGVPAFITTYAAQTNQTAASGNIAGVGTTFGGTNISGSMTLNSAGLALSLSGPAAGGGGVVIQGSGNTTGTMNTYSSGTFVLAGGSNITLSQSSNSMSFNAPNASSLVAGANITISTAGSTISIIGAAGGGGGGVTINDYEIFPLGNNTSFSSYSQNALHFQRIMPVNNVSMTAIEMLISMSSATSSVSHSVGHTMSYGIYTKGTGASTSQMQSMATSSFYIQASYSSNLSGGYTIAQGTNSFTSSSAGTVFGSVLSGQKILSLPFSTSLAAGGDYFLCFAQSSASVGNTGAIRMSHVVQTIASNGSWGQLDIGGARVSNSSYSNEPFMVSYSATSGVWAATLAKSDMRNNANSVNQMYALLEA